MKNISCYISPKFCIFLGITNFLVLTSCPIYAFDVGLSGDPGSSNKTSRIEVVSELFKRDIVQETANSRRTFEGEQDEQRWFIRYFAPVAQKWHLHLSAGGTDSDDSEGYVPLLGAGFDYAAVQKEDYQIAIFGAVFYSDEITYKNTGTTLDNVGFISERNENYVEAGLGVRFARNFVLTDRIDLTPYLGMQFGIVQAEGKERLDFPDNPEIESRSDTSVDFEQDGFLSAHAGLRLTLSSGIIARFETRVIDQKSISLALGYRF